MTEYQLITGKPKIFAISNDIQLLKDVEEYVKDYDYEFIGSASESDNIFREIMQASPDLIFLDTEIENIDLSEVTGDLELFNVPIILIIGTKLDETIDQLLMSNPYGYLIKDINKAELQRSMAVALKKHDQNIQNINYAKDRIKEKNIELMIEKLDSSFLLIICVSLIIIAILSRNATWLQWVLLIPTVAMLINSLVSIKKQKKVVEYEPDELPFVSVFIPAHNEENTIGSTVASVCNSDYSIGDEINYELIVINDGSTDNTGEILSNLKKDYPQLKIVTRHPPRSGKGKGFVLNDALTLSKGEIIGVFDADTQIKSDYLKTIVQYLNGDIDGVQSRVKMFSSIPNPPCPLGM